MKSAKEPLNAPQMAVEIAGVRFKNPVLTASGTFAFKIKLK